MRAPPIAYLGTTPSATTTIENDDITVGVQVIGQPQFEGNPGNPQTFNFVMSLSDPASKAVNVTYQVVDGTAISGQDFTGFVGLRTLTFNPGETSKTIGIDATPDTLVEGNETFSIELQTVDSGTILSSAKSAIATLINDNSEPKISVIDKTPNNAEGNTGTKPFIYEIELSNPSDKAVTVKYETVDGTATLADLDYEAISPTLLTFAPNETKKTITVNVTGDSKSEAAETFSVKFTEATNANLGGGVTSLFVESTIANDDDKPALSILGNTITEGDSSTTPTPMVFKVNLSSASDEEVTVEFIVVYGTAKVNE